MNHTDLIAPRSDTDSKQASRSRAIAGIEHVLDDRLVHTLYQPIVDLDSGLVAGFEALTRGPAGIMESPDALFSAARDADRLTEMDWLCRQAAVDTARNAGFRAPLSLLVNTEPETLLADRRDPSRWGSSRICGATAK